MVENAALSSSPPLEVWSTTNSQQFTWPGATPGTKLKISWGWVTPDYFSTMGMQMKKGRSFYPDIRSDSADIIINENLAGIMGKAAHIGGYVSVDHQWLRIVGIVQDYLFNDMRGAVSPLILTCERDAKGVYGYMEIRLKPGNNLPASLTKMEEVIKTHNPAYPVDYHFVDQNYEEQFTIEAKVGQFAGIFSSMAVLISCMGLFGLAAYTTERRTKEIGIRKVLGASTAGLARLSQKNSFSWSRFPVSSPFPWLGGLWITG